LETAVTRRKASHAKTTYSDIFEKIMDSSIPESTSISEESEAKAIYVFIHALGQKRVRVVAYEKAMIHSTYKLYRFASPKFSVPHRKIYPAWRTSDTSKNASNYVIFKNIKRSLSHIWEPSISDFPLKNAPCKKDRFFLYLSLPTLSHRFSFRSPFSHILIIFLPLAEPQVADF
jgi:hypothetical protein